MADAVKSATVTPACSVARPPSKGPAHITNAALIRRAKRASDPPTKDESAARPVSVMVRTVVVTSGSAILRARILSSHRDAERGDDRRAVRVRDKTQ